jgi:hypothetical protein
MGQTINAGGLYSSVMPNCSCIYKFDGFTRVNELNINVPGSNFYDYSKRTEIDENDNEITVPDWKVVDNKLVAQVANPWVSFRSTIPLGMVFYYGGYEKADFKLNLYYNEEKVGLYFQKNEYNEYESKLDGVYSKQEPLLLYTKDSIFVYHIIDSIFNFSHYTESESCFKSFAVCNGYYANGVEPTESGILYKIEFDGATIGQTYLTNLVLQRNTLECLNLNNENTRLLPNNIIYPTGYLSIPVRGACRDSINTVFSWNSEVGYKKTKNNSFGYRQGFIKSNNINNNYCESCYELQERLINVGIDKDAEINRLDELILELDIEWLSKQEELSQTEDAEAIANINEEIRIIEEKTRLLKEEKALVKSSVSKAEPEDLEKIIIPHNRGAYLPVCNPCLKPSSPKVTVSFEAKVKLVPYFKGTGVNLCNASQPPNGIGISYNEMELVTPEDIDIGGTYELEQQGATGCTFSGSFKKTYNKQCIDGSTQEEEYTLSVSCSIYLAFIDFETGKKRHKITVGAGAFIGIEPFGIGGASIEFVGEEYIDSVDDICGKTITVKSSKPGYITGACSSIEQDYCDNIGSGYEYITEEDSCTDCPASAPANTRTVKRFISYLYDTARNSCETYVVKTEGNRTRIGAERAEADSCEEINIEVEIT